MSKQMSKQLAQKAVPDAHALRKNIRGGIAVVACALALFLVCPASTSAAVSSTINFQSRLETASGAIVPDGAYNVEFKLYDASSSSGSSQGSCTGDAHCLWTETRVSADMVRVANGYLTVNLGSVTAFGTINWNQQLWLTMNIGGTGSASWDGEMSPRIQLTALPYVFQAGELGNGTNRATLDSSGNFVFQQASTVKAAQPASAGAGLQLAVQGGAANGSGNTGGNLLLQGGAAGGGTAVSGSVVVRSNGTNSGTAFQIQDASSSTLVNADTTNMRLGVNLTYASMNAVGTLTLGQGGTGGSLTALGTYFYKVTAIDSAGGETTASPENSLTLTGSNTKITISWTAVTGASGYKIYRSTTTNTEVYLTTILTNSYTDAGSVTPGTATPPGSNTAYVSTNVSNSSLQLSIGGNGTPTGQLYVSGTVPTTFVGSVAAGGSNFGDVYVQGRYAYVVDTALRIIDVSDPAAPVLIGSGSTGGGPDGVVVQGRYAYVANFTTNTVQIYDVSNPASPTSLSTVDVNTRPRDIYVQGRYAYVVSDTSNTFQIIDVANPSNPVVVGSSGTDAFPLHIAVQGKYAYVSSHNANTIQIFDVSNPASPSFVGGILLSAGGADDFYVQGRYIYIVNNGALKVVDISNISNVTTVGAITVASAWGVGPTST
jgi:hypothetical protein